MKPKIRQIHLPSFLSILLRHLFQLNSRWELPGEGEMGDADVIQDQPELHGPGGQVTLDSVTEHLHI